MRIVCWNGAQAGIREKIAVANSLHSLFWSSPLFTLQTDRQTLQCQRKKRQSPSFSPLVTIDNACHSTASPETWLWFFSLPNCILLDDCLSRAALFLAHIKWHFFMLKILKSKCQGVLVVGWPESPSAESNRRADSAGRIGVSDVSNRLEDITTHSEQ